MEGLIVAVIVAVGLLAIALWAIWKLAPPDMRRPLEIVVIVIFLVWLVLKLSPLVSGVL